MKSEVQMIEDLKGAEYLKRVGRIVTDWKSFKNKLVKPTWNCHGNELNFDESCSTCGHYYRRLVRQK